MAKVTMTKHELTVKKPNIETDFNIWDVVLREYYVDGGGMKYTFSFMSDRVMTAEEFAEISYKATMQLIQLATKQPPSTK